MLKRLFVSNYALIENLDVSLEKGFTVITGETGSGKSILLGALGLITGERADTSVLLPGRHKCVVEGTFLVDLGLKEFFTGNDLDYQEESIIRREISENGKSRAFINDTPVNLQQLKELSSSLVDIHSQFESITIGKPHYRIEVLDAYAGNKSQTENYRKLYNKYTRERKKLEELKAEEAQSRSDEDYLKFQLNELEEAGIGAHDFSSMEESFRLQSNAGEIKTVLEEVGNLLSGEHHSAFAAITEAWQRLKKISGHSSSLTEIYDRLNSVMIEMKDIHTELSLQSDKTEVSEETLVELSAKLDKFNSLLLKHRVRNETELKLLKETWEEKLQSIGTLEEEIKRVEKEVAEITRQLAEEAEKLSKARKKAAQNFEKKINALLATLAMPHAQFSVDIHPLDAYNMFGQDDVVFLFAANKGTPLQPLHKTASGGELSRVLLCIKALSSKSALIPTLIFDEIDSGVSGDIAGKMGKIMQQMGGDMQLICISHLPQVAGMGNRHFKVYKETEKNTTITRIAELTNEERVEEIAKMLSGEKITEAAVEHAKSLLSQE